MNEERLHNLEREVLRRKAVVSFPHFLDYTDPNYSRQWFHTLIAEKCQDLLLGKLETDRLMVFVGPQHGKSEIVSRKFPAWALGYNPKLKVVGTSYAANLAQGFSRSIQRTIDSPEYKEVFPCTFLNSQNVSTDARRGYLRNIDIFETVGHGGFYRAVGVGGGLTGTTVDLGIIDDPIKGADAYSPAMRDRLWGWYTDVLLTRLHRASRLLLIMTRWHEDDLAGRILAREPDRWAVLRIPAVREPGPAPYPDPRAPGEPLWPEMHPLEALLDAERLSPATFHALYQQRPTAEGGNIVRRDWLPTVPLGEFQRLRAAADAPMVFFLDTAYTERQRNDPSGIIAACRVGPNLYIAHAARVRKAFPDLVRWVPDYVRAHGYSARSTLRVEPKANGISVIDQLRRDTDLNVARTPSPREGKTARLHAATPAIEAGRVRLVEGGWNAMLADEVCGFPAAPHDEFVDCLCYAVEHLLGPGAAPIDARRIERVAF